MASSDHSPPNCPPGDQRVTKELLRTVISKFHRSEYPDADIEIHNWDMKQVTGKRIGFLSEQVPVVVRYTLKGQDLYEGENFCVDLFFKFLPDDQQFRTLIQKNQFVMREVKFYREVLPALECIEKTYLSEEDRAVPWAPKFYYGQFDEWKDSLLVLKNMDPLGYNVSDFNEGLSYLETKSALIAIANFHAASLALEVKDGQLQQQFPFLYPVEKAVECYITLIEACIPFTLKLFDNRKDREEVREGLVHFLNKYDLQAKLREVLTPSGKLNTLLHADFWSNNLLLKKQGDDVLSCIIDWQMLSYGSPALDISVIMWLSLSPSVRRQYGQTLCSDYWNAFTSRLEKFGIDLETLDYTIKDFHEDLKIASLFPTFLMIGCTDRLSNFPNLAERNVEMIADLLKDGLLS